MTLRIHLDNDGIRTLFPEGSQARVDLANGVIENFTKHNRKFIDVTLLREHEKAIGAEVTRLIDESVKNAMPTVLKELGIEEVKPTYYSSRPAYRIPAEALDELTGRARRMLMDESDKIAEQQFERLRILMSPIEARLAEFLEKTEARIVEAEARVSVALTDEAIADRIAEHYLTSRAEQLDADMEMIRKAVKVA